MPGIDNPQTRRRITVARGDGIGPEIMDATLAILEGANAGLDYEFIDIGEKVYLKGLSSGIAPESWDSLRRNKVFLKAPITTPQGGGFKSLNVTTRKALGLYANVRPCVSYHPYVATRHPVMNVVIVRENEEDLYAGIEHRPTAQVMQCLKLISRPGCERIVRYAFDYATRNGRKKVTCFTKDNIMKMTDGLFHGVFDEIGREFPELEKEHWIVDIGAAKLADTPEAFDVVVMPNLYGDILSDVAAQIAGSVGLAGSANIGAEYAMFEAIHGSAPRRAGQNLANPSGLMLGAVMMLVHLGKYAEAERVHNAWLRALEDGVHTYDIYKENVSREKVGTQQFAEAVVARMGEKPQKLRPAAYSGGLTCAATAGTPRPQPDKRLVGVDLVLDWPNASPDQVGEKARALDAASLHLASVSNRGMKVWPAGEAAVQCTDHWQCRFMGNSTVPHEDVVALLARAAAAGLDFVQVMNLYNFDGLAGFTKGQGE